MAFLGRYFRLWLAFGRYALARELTFRTNFLVKISVELLWLAILIIFYRTVFAQTTVVANWQQWQFLFFLGCYFALEGLIETLFLENCVEFADLVRSGDLDFILLKPIDEQFLVTCRQIDWSTAANFLLGMAVMGIALFQGISLEEIPMPSPVEVVWFGVLFLCGLAMAYSFLLILTSLSVWLIRNQNIMEMWWLFTSLMRYPRQVLTQTAWFYPIGWFFSFVVPVLLVVSVPAEVMAKPLKADNVEPLTVAVALSGTGLLLFVSRWFFWYALRRYRSASS